MGEEDRFAAAVKKISELAWNISCWIDERRITLHLDLGDTIEGIVRRVAEEIRVRKKVELEDKVQIGRLQWAIDELSTLVGNYEDQLTTHDCEDTFAPPLTPIPEVDDDDECSNPPSPTGTVVSLPPSPPMTPEHFVRKHRLSISSDDETVVSRSASPFKPSKLVHTPLRLIFPPSPSLDSQADDDFSPPSPTSLQGSPPVPGSSGSSLMPSALPINVGLKRSLSSTSASYFPLMAKLAEELPNAPQESESSSSSQTDAESADEDEMPNAGTLLSEASGPSPLPPKPSVSLRHSDSLCSIRDYYCKHCREQIGPFGYAVTGNVGCVVTGFLVGAFIALCVASSPRRTLLVAT